MMLLMLLKHHCCLSWPEFVTSSELEKGAGNYQLQQQGGSQACSVFGFTCTH